jgi:hypothetical protein
MLIAAEIEMGRAEVGFVVVEGKGGGGFATIMELVI